MRMIGVKLGITLDSTCDLLTRPKIGDKIMVEKIKERLKHEGIPYSD